MNSAKKILLTGSRGFFGSRFIETYSNVFNILPTNSDTLNITDKSKVMDVFETFKPDYVIHAAAVAVTEFCNNNPGLCHSINVRGTLNIAEACEKTSSRLIFLSTEQVFNGNTTPGPYSEADKPEPDTVYGENKLEAEELIAEFCDNHIILRLTWLFGIPKISQPVSGNILWDTIKLLMIGQPERVPVNEYRGLTYIEDLLNQFPKLLNLPSGIFHTGSETSLNRYEIVYHIIKELGLEHRIKELILKDETKYKNTVRDIRLKTALIQNAGITFPRSEEAISRCIRENYLNVN